MIFLDVLVIVDFIVMILDAALLSKTSPLTVTFSLIIQGFTNFNDCEKCNACFPGKYIPINLEKNDPKSIPWHTLPWNPLEIAYLLSVCYGLKSPESFAKLSNMDSVTVT